ncbi:hypothetical protein G6O69_11565 [Pseudenhygromyxa sp. WMMC2535]|uniref:hypothetical protein n=1 Tax=Pseudenhygromyxa sp. WMMC2535 TaxID=2712867 RepID=UPI0015568D99|nr:hypothetical protein [Pseudenhygromyxa sp. WMMC2535]NVB38471.1 hypothetical protein [Pseudenhygromyxa sp. WMMC2535]
MSQPRTESSSAAQSATQAGAPQAGRARAILGWLLPIVLGAGAVGFQFALDVPKGEMIPRADKKDEKKPASRERTTRGKRTKRAGWEARSAQRVAVLRESWENQDVADEPVDEQFRRHHESLLRSAVSLARRDALDGGSAVIQTWPTCHLIRCELELCGPTPAVDGIGESLALVRWGQEPLWRELSEVEPTREPREPQTDPARQPGGEKAGKAKKAKKGEEARSCRRWVVSFENDGVARHELRMEGDEEPEDEEPGDEGPEDEGGAAEGDAIIGGRGE